jgi:hypothetical protein
VVERLAKEQEEQAVWDNMKLLDLVSVSHSLPEQRMITV